MKKLCYFIFLTFLGIKSSAQQNYFIYIQSDERQPFYAVLNSKVFSSSETGYLIIPKLGDSSYQLLIGFAKNAFPEQRFQVSINKKDQGFQLKNLNEKGWGLFNLQTLSLIMGASGVQKQSSELTGTKKTDAFSALLANVVNDTAILYTANKAAPAPENTEVVSKKAPEVAPKEVDTQSIVAQQPQQSAAPEPVVDPVADTSKTSPSDSSPIPAQPNEPVAASANPKPENQVPEQPATILKPEKPFISRLEERTTGEMYRAVYLEQYSLVTDTIVISIPFDEKPQSVPDAPKEEQAVKSTPLPDSPRSSVQSEATTTTSPVKKPAMVIMNSDCKNFATEYDIDKLRVRLINDKTIEDKKGTVKKFLKNRCITVSQVKALTELFPTDETKMLFFEISYPFVSDSSNVYLLEEFLQGSLYKNRLRQMIGQ